MTDFVTVVSKRNRNIVSAALVSAPLMTAPKNVVCAPNRAALPMSGRAKSVPCCRHCTNVGLPSDHWLRSKDGVTTCPVLLANKCSYCHLPGHTLKLCPELKAKNERLANRPLSLVHPEKIEIYEYDLVSFHPSSNSVAEPDVVHVSDVPSHVYRENEQAFYKKYVGRSWADMTDSDSD